jgi:hypothetical protein
VEYSRFAKVLRSLGAAGEVRPADVAPLPVMVSGAHQVGSARSGTAGTGPVARGGPTTRRWLALAAWVLLLVVAFAANLRLSQTMAANSDSAGPVLQGWDMLHGNLLQHGWITADVPYFPTEVPEYALVGLVRGLNSDVIHWGGALTYTLAMLLVALLAMGKAGAAPEAGGSTGRERVVRAAIAAGIMIAPQLQAGTYTLLLGPDHFGTAVPVLLVWLVLDRAAPRWYIPVIAALVLGWTGVADLTALFIGALPLACVYGYRVLRARFSENLTLAAQGYEIALVAAGIVAAAMAVEGPHILSAMGSLYHATPQTQFSSLHEIFRNNLRVTGQCLLILAGADFIGVHQPVQAALAILHLVGAALGAAAILLAVWRFLRDKDVISQLLVAGIALNLVTFVIGTHSLEITYAREITPVLSLSAVLAGRLLARRLIAVRPLGLRLAPVLAVVLCGYLAGLGYEIRQPVAPAQNAAVIPFLKAHHLRSGLSGYWGANVLTLDTGGQITIRSLDSVGGKLRPSQKLDKPEWYDPRVETANFVVLYRGPAGTPPFRGFTGIPPFYLPKQVVATFGEPAQVYRYGTFTIMIWNKNLLADMRFPAIRK